MSQLNDNTINLQSILDTVNALPESITVDDALSTTSTNPVQNKIVTEALNGKANATHNQAASTITAGTFGGTTLASRSSQTASSYLLRNSRLDSIESTPSYNGEICWTYE